MQITGGLLNTTSVAASSKHLKHLTDFLMLTAVPVSYL